MSETTKVLLPDIGDFADVEIIEILVAVGDTIEVEQSILTLESDKATMDVPSSEAGEISEIGVSIGDKISEGDYLITVRAAAATGNATQEQQPAAPQQSAAEDAPAPAAAPSASAKPAPAEQPPSDAARTQDIDVLLPDIGDFSNVEIIEIHIAAGDTIEAEASMLTLESDKATMDVPAPENGTVTELLVKVGDKVSKGDRLAKMQTGTSPAAESAIEQPPESAASATESALAPQSAAQALSHSFDVPPPPATLPPPVERSKTSLPHASPSVRRFARELGADLSQVRGTGPKGRILRDDIALYVKKILREGPQPDARQSLGPPPIPEVDFSKFGSIETVKLSKIKRITGERLHRSWLDIPHVTHHDEADITELDLFRKAVDNEQKASGNRVTILAFVCKAIINALTQFPTFNASLSPNGQDLILKRYFNIGVAVDTPNGLVVPVIRDMQKLGVLDIARTLQEIGRKARDGELAPADFQGGCFTISSLGGIGGRFFTPIINPPEVAILGVSRNHQVPVPADNGNLAWKTMLPLSLSYDHRVIDGAEAARFTKFVCELLVDSRRILL